jgi:bacteriocin biosynthesis cyclodehydratase domain-containing protein
MRNDDHQDRPSGRSGVVHLEGQLGRSTSEPPAERAGGAARVRLHPSVETLPSPDGDLLIIRGGTRATGAIPAPSPAELALLDALADGWSTVAELTHTTGHGDVRGALTALDANGLLEWRAPAGESPLSAADLARFDRQLPYLADIVPGRSPDSVQRALRDRHVAVLGCGGLGSWAVQALALSGIGRLTLIDPDTVELSNLNRQALYGPADLRRPKALAAREAVARMDPGVEVTAIERAVTSAEDAADWLAGADALIQTADSPPYDLERWINRACVQLGLPHLTAAQQPPLLRVGPLVLPGRTACYACQEAATRREYPLYDALVARRRSRPAVAATLGVASGVVGTMLAAEVLHLLLGLVPATAGAALLLDLVTWSARWERFEREPGCPVCGPVAER